MSFCTLTKFVSGMFPVCFSPVLRVVTMCCLFQADGGDQTKLWYRQLQYHAQGMGAWRRRRNALANIMINGMQTRS